MAADRPPFGALDHTTKRVRVSGSKFEIFLFGLGLGYIMVCDLTSVCVQVHIVILIKELARDAARKVSHPRHFIE